MTTDKDPRECAAEIVDALLARADNPLDRFVFVKKLRDEAREGRTPCEHAPSFLEEECNARLPELEAAAGSSAKSEIGDVMLHAVRRGKEANIRQCLAAINACDTMLKGLPNLEEVFEPDRETIRLQIGSFVKRLREKGEISPEGADDVREGLAGLHEYLRPFLKSWKTMVKTQATLAKYLRHMATLNLIYASSDTISADAAQIAARMGKTDAVREFARAKFGDVL